jgi:hypothetical protein
MLSLDQTIAEATALHEGIKTAQERLAQIDSGAVQTIPGNLALAQIRQLFAARKIT